jgi:hypothetical protein
MAGSAFGNAIEFMARLGVFDVVLPFLLVFTLIFAFLEKTKIFGTEQYLSDDGKMHTISRKNLNSMAAFSISFFVVASTQLVALISEVTSKVVLLIILIFSFTLTVGAFHKQEKEGFFLNDTWKVIFEVIVFLGIIIIFMDALGWLDAIFEWIGSIWTNEAGAAILMVLVIVGFMAYIVAEPKAKSSKKDDKAD